MIETARTRRKAEHAMKVSIPREIKNHEYRVAITPAGVRELAARGHEVYLEKSAGAGSRLTDEAYIAAGATIVADADEVWGGRRPGAEGQGADRGGVPPHARRAWRSSPTCTWPPTEACTDALLASRDTAIAYETVQLRRRVAAAARPDVRGRGPSRPAGRRLQPDAQSGGYGVLLGGVPGAAPRRSS